MRPAEVDGLVEEVASMVSLGVDGVVVGVLDGAGRVDRGALSELVNAASGRPVTFHRAFDEVEDPLGEVESLIEAGVKRVLTSGGALTAWEGREVLRKLVELCSNRLTVLGGGGVRGDHVAQLVEMTGLAEVHARASAVAGVVGGLG
jgi:copper homeostasis protein